VDGVSFGGALDRELQAIGFRFNRVPSLGPRPELYFDFATFSFQIPAWLSAAWALLPRRIVDTPSSGV
jgi:hypothetical protein